MLLSTKIFGLLLGGITAFLIPSHGAPCCTGLPRHFCGFDDWFLDKSQCEAVWGCYWAESWIWPDRNSCHGSPKLCHFFHGNREQCEKQGCTFIQDSEDECQPAPSDTDTNAEKYFNMTPIVIGPDMARNKRLRMTLADINGDGDLDILVGSRSNDDPLILALHKMGTTFHPPFVISTDPQDTFGRVNAMATGDLDGDGTTDVVVALQRHYGVLNDGAAILAYYGDGTGGFRKEVIVSEETQTFGTVSLEEVTAWDIKLVDMNDDSNLDIIASLADGKHRLFHGNNNGPGVLLYLQNNGYGGFDTFPLSDDELVGWIGVDVADFDNDGRKDVALISEELGSVSVYFSNLPNGGFSRIVIDNSTDDSYWALTTGDVDMDGKADIVCQGKKSVVLYRNLGDSGQFEKVVLVNTFLIDVDITSLGRSPRKVKIHDVDGDGLNDIIHLRTPLYEIHWIRQIISNPLKFQPYKTLVEDMVSCDFAIGDVNGDGVDDIAVAADRADGNVYAFLGIAQNKDNPTRPMGIDDNDNDPTPSSGIQVGTMLHSVAVALLLVSWII